jgi:hypothetical protein
MPDPKDPDLPDDAPPPEYEPGRTPQEIPFAPPLGDPDDGRPRDPLGRRVPNRLRR